ncbi:7684_t:CDS:2, partial [Funneliformis geosporum]
KLKRSLSTVVRKTKKTVNLHGGGFPFTETDKESITATRPLRKSSSAINLQQSYENNGVPPKLNRRLSVNLHEGGPFLILDNTPHPSLRKCSSTSNLQQSYKSNDASLELKRSLTTVVRNKSVNLHEEIPSSTNPKKKFSLPFLRKQQTNENNSAQNLERNHSEVVPINDSSTDTDSISISSISSNESQSSTSTANTTDMTKSTNKLLYLLNNFNGALNGSSLGRNVKDKKRKKYNLTEIMVSNEIRITSSDSKDIMDDYGCSFTKNYVHTSHTINTSIYYNQCGSAGTDNLPNLPQIKLNEETLPISNKIVPLPALIKGDLLKEPLLLPPSIKISPSSEYDDITGTWPFAQFPKRSSFNNRSNLHLHDRKNSSSRSPPTTDQRPPIPNCCIYGVCKRCKRHQGGYGDTYWAKWIDGKIIDLNEDGSWDRMGENDVALKILHNSQSISQEYLDAFVAYQKRTSKLNNVLKFYGISRDPFTKNLIMVMEYAKDGNLRDYLINNFMNVTWTKRISMLYDIAQSLKSIHEGKLIHKDLHSGNVFIHDDQAFVGDLGFCSKIRKKFSSSAYVAPELSKGDQFIMATMASDIYSFAMIMYELATFIPLYPNYSDDECGIHEGTSQIILKGIPNCYVELMTQCWSQRPEERPNADHIAQTIKGWNMTGNLFSALI